MTNAVNPPAEPAPAAIHAAAAKHAGHIRLLPRLESSLLVVAYCKDARQAPVSTRLFGFRGSFLVWVFGLGKFLAAMIYSVGHSNHPLTHFLGLLQGRGVNLLVDVRSTPYSRFNPQFRRDALAAALSENGIGYLFLGEELGARSKDPSCYDDGRVSYQKLAATALFRQGIDRLLTAAKTHTVAIMCAEKDPLDCHRTILVARELVNRGETVTHILATGEVESHDQAMQRLRKKLKLEPEDLFGGDVNEQAYELRGQQIAYVDPKVARSSR
jgi:hypothetical protein